MVPGQHAWNPKEAGTKMVAIGTVLGKTKQADTKRAIGNMLLAMSSKHLKDDS